MELAQTTIKISVYVVNVTACQMFYEPNLLEVHFNTARQALWSSFFIWENGASERLTDFPKVTQLMKAITEFQT